MSKKKQKIDSAYYVSLIERITTLHGTSHFTSKSGRSLVLWSLAVLGNVMLTIAFVMVIKQKFNENQIVTAINANCKVNQVPFPAVSICNFNMVSVKESQNIARVLKHYNKTDEEIRNFFNALPTLNKFGKRTQELGNFTEIMNILKHHFFTIDTIMEEVHQKCENLILYCTFNRKAKNCDDMFVLIKTYEGHCCTFNYAALNDASEVSLLPSTPDKDLEYYDDQNPDGGTTTNPTIIATSESGRETGLSVVFNVEPKDYPSWSDVPFYGVKVLISDPNDYPETTILYRYITLGESVDIKVEPMVFQSDSNVRRVEPKNRGCWFHDEVALSHTNRYSYETCVTECRMKNYMEACNCVPYKYPREKSTRICEFKDLRCLNNVTVHKSTKEMQCDPVCYMECRDKKYSVDSDLTPFLPDNYPDEVTAGVNVSELAALQVFFDKSNCNCYKLTLLIDLSYFIEKSTRICEFKDLRCLNNVTVHKSTKEMQCDPVCYMECRDKKYSVDSDLTPFLPDNYPDEVTAGVNVSELAALQVFFDKSNCNCYKLTLLIDLSYFIATYGGVFSLSFGGSIISLVEITYLFVSFILTVVLRIATIVISRRQLNSM